MQYDVGDMVVVREDILAGEYYNGIYCNDDMSGIWAGKELTIRRVCSFHYEVLENGWAWSDDMFENPVSPDWDGVDLDLFFGGT